MSRADSGAFALVSMKARATKGSLSWRLCQFSSPVIAPARGPAGGMWTAGGGRGGALLKALMLNLLTGCFCELNGFLQRSRPSVEIGLNNLHFIEGNLDEREGRDLFY